jgi:hypothetical protein
MLFTITDSYENVPAGTYQATFSGMKETETANGKAYRWAFKADDGRTISGLSDAEKPPTTKNKTGRWLCALGAKPLQAGTEVDPDSYIGKRYFVIVAAALDNKTKLETFSPLPA